MIPAHLYKDIEFIRLGGLTKRYHTKHVIHENTVGHHSFGVAWLVQMLDPACRKELILAALAHDLAEQVTGDISSPTKRRFPVIADMISALEGEVLEEHGCHFEVQLTTPEKRILKMADCMDGMLYCISERSLGNISIMLVYQRYLTYVNELNPRGREYEVLCVIRRQMEAYYEH